MYTIEGNAFIPAGDGIYKLFPAAVKSAVGTPYDGNMLIFEVCVRYAAYEFSA